MIMALSGPKHGSIVSLPCKFSAWDKPDDSVSKREAGYAVVTCSVALRLRTFGAAQTPQPAASRLAIVASIKALSI